MLNLPPFLTLPLRQIAGEELLVEITGVVVLLPVPVGQIPRQRGQRHVDAADFQRAAGFRRLLGLGRCGFGARRHDGDGRSGTDAIDANLVMVSLRALRLRSLPTYRPPRMRGSSRSRIASPNTLMA